jgi:23S rRNA pseudouridine1911/1915/1917 synthase
VTVSGNLCLDAGRRLQAAEVVKLLGRPAPAVPTERDVRLRYVDEHVIIVEKPAGMTSIRHPEERRWPARRKQLQPTLDEVLPQLVAAARVRDTTGKRPRGIPPPVRPVHRLDRDTSGLMVFARTIRAERSLGEQFRRHTIERRYLALVFGTVAAQTFESYLARDRGDGRRGSTTQTQQGKHAVTHVRPVERLAAYTLVECQLETGRTHQIRIHMSEAGHPVCGDKIYFTSFQGPPRSDVSGAPRLALHAGVLGLEHPITGEPVRFEMPLPLDLRQLTDELRDAGVSGKTARAGGQQRARRRHNARKKKREQP